MCFLPTTFPNAPAHPLPPPILFDQSLIVCKIISYYTITSITTSLPGIHNNRYSMCKVKCHQPCDPVIAYV